MIGTFKFKSRDYDNIWIFSDLHLNQKSGVVLKGRGFANMNTHDEFITASFHKLITKDSLVINFGDSHFNDPTGEQFERFSLWPCKQHIYAWGNHTSGARQIFFRETKLRYSEGVEVYPLAVNNITFIGNYLHFSIDGKQIIGGHFPFHVWDGGHKGFWHLMGHSHHSCPATQPSTPAGKSCDVGVESALLYSDGKCPFFKWTDIQDIMNTKHIVQRDHHDAHTT